MERNREQLAHSPSLKSFWQSNGMDFVADLGTMKKAIVVAYYTPIFDKPYYSISPRSYFPFTDKQLNTKYSDFTKCCIDAEGIIVDWMQSLMTPFEIRADRVEIEVSEVNLLK